MDCFSEAKFHFRDLLTALGAFFYLTLHPAGQVCVVPQPLALPTEAEEKGGIRGLPSSLTSSEVFSISGKVAGEVYLARGWTKPVSGTLRRIWLDS